MGDFSFVRGVKYVEAHAQKHAGAAADDFAEGILCTSGERECEENMKMSLATLSLLGRRITHPHNDNDVTVIGSDAG